MGLDGLIELVVNLTACMEELNNRGWCDKDRAFRKLIEEIGEYAEAVEYRNDSTRKVEKFSRLGISKYYKIKEELSDIIAMSFALAYSEGFTPADIIKSTVEKLSSFNDGGRR